MSIQKESSKKEFGTFESGVKYWKIGGSTICCRSNFLHYAIIIYIFLGCDAFL